MSLLQSEENSFSKLSKYLAIDRQIERHKEEYYLILNKCSDGKFSPDPTQYKIEYFAQFMIKVLELSLKDIDVYRNKYTAYRDLSESASKVLECFRDKPELRFQTKQLCKATDIPRRTVIQALNHLVKNNFIQKRGQGRGVRYQLVF
jgi:Fic family protein